MKLCMVFTLVASGCAVGGVEQVGVEGDAGRASAVDAASDAAPKKTPPEAGTPTQTDAGQTPGDDASVPLTDSTCAAESTKSDCEQCCLTVHPTGYTTYNQALQTCACTSPAACATECATELCAAKPAASGDACDMCVTAALMSTGACYGAVDTACQGDPDCVTLFQTCIPPCESK